MNEVRETSREAFLKIKATLPRARREAFEAVELYGLGTDNEIRQRLHAAGCTSFEHLDGLGKRYSELRRLGVIREAEVRRCSVSGKRCIVWEVTGEMPKNLELQRVKKLRSLKTAVIAAAIQYRKAASAEVVSVGDCDSAEDILLGATRELMEALA